MSALSEYLKLIPKGLPNSLSIIQGIINSVRLEHGNMPEEEIEEITKRRLICTLCPFNSNNARTSEEYFALNNVHYKTKREDAHCSLCGCPINTKTASLYANCGIEDWNERFPQKAMELKWKSLKE